MKTILYCFVIMASLLCLTSCKKENLSQSLVGKWKAVERFNGYADGGDFTWKEVPNTYQFIIEFFNNGQYIETDPSGATYSGSYQLINNNQIRFIATGSTGYSDLYFALLPNANLIINYQVREGVIKEKYIQIN
jgi:hypothetical protein